MENADSAAAGVTLGRVEITDQNYAPAPTLIEAKMFDRAAAPGVPVQGGENAYASRSR